MSNRFDDKKKGRVAMHEIQTGNYQCLEIFLKSLDGREGKLQIRKKKGIWREYPAGRFQYRLVKIPMEKNTRYELKLIHCEVSITYLSESADIMEQGVRFLEYQNGEWTEIENLHDWYDTPNREQYHFNAFKNWINDPNGLCYYKGYYHLYYQANPHSQEWNHMYWGHAASKDLMHWIHLPYVLEPQEEILESNHKKGGAFSGSAAVLDDEIVFYLTRHLGPPEDSEEDTIQYQTMVTSKDGIHFEKEIEIIRKPDETFSYNFRDPKVFLFEGIWQMILGAKVKGIPSLVRYSSEDGRAWNYEGVLLAEHTDGVYTFECPDFFPIDGVFTAVGSWMMYVDEQRRYQPTYYYIGNYEKENFHVKYRGLYDFGSNFYAVQSFEHNGRRIAIGWTADCYQEHVKEENGSYGAMAIPRELSVKNNILYRKPVEEIYTLLGKNICDVTGQNLSIKHLNQNGYYARIDFNKSTDFTILLGVSKDGKLWLIKEQKCIRIKTEGVKSKYVNFETEVEQVKKVEIFVDRRLTEVFINDGEEAGTKLFYQDSSDGIFKASFQEEGEVDRIQIFAMESIWR